MTTASRLRDRARALGPRSLSGRLLLGSALATLLALAIMLVLMDQVLTRFVTGQIDQRLDNKIVALASQVRVASDGTLSLEGQADGPPFDKRHHRSFWLVQGPRNALMTGWLAPGDMAVPSLSQIEAALARPAPPAPGPDGLDTHPRTLRRTALDGVALHERVARTRISGIEITILVAAPMSAINDPVAEAATRMGFGILVLGFALAALALAQIQLGLRPLATLRRHVAEVGDGRRALLPEDQPLEVAPLVVEMNILLARNAANLDKARRHVANLAHGLKTPLATLQLGVERLDGPGKEEMRLLMTQIDLRLRHHLGRARSGALSGPVRVSACLAPRLDDIAAALRRIHADRGVVLSIDCPADLDLACEAHDVDEIFGNLLDNACKFARAIVTCSARRDGRQVVTLIADDGPGLSSGQIAVAMEPGQRLDEQVPGFGFGLTIARELVELYGGDLRLEAGEGLRVSVCLPAAGGNGSHSDRGA